MRGPWSGTVVVAVLAAGLPNGVSSWAETAVTVAVAGRVASMSDRYGAHRISCVVVVFCACRMAAASELILVTSPYLRLLGQQLRRRRLRGVQLSLCRRQLEACETVSDGRDCDHDGASEQQATLETLDLLALRYFERQEVHAGIAADG